MTESTDDKLQKSKIVPWNESVLSSSVFIMVLVQTRKTNFICVLVMVGETTKLVTLELIHSEHLKLSIEVFTAMLRFELPHQNVSESYLLKLILPSAAELLACGDNEHNKCEFRNFSTSEWFSVSAFPYVEGFEKFYLQQVYRTKFQSLLQLTIFPEHR